MTGTDAFSVVSAVFARQRACRSFSGDDVDDRLVEQCLAAATWAPSAENSQPWEFVVVRDPSIRTRIGDIVERAWTGGGRDWAAQHLDPRLFDDVDRGATGGIAAAPVAVVVAADRRRCPSDAVAASIFPAVQNLLLAATALGLGSALTTLATYLADDLRAAVGLPEPVEPMAVIPLGWPSRRLGPPRRDPADDHTHRETWGHAWRTETNRPG